MVRTPCACLLSHFCCAWLSVIPWTITCQAPLSMGFSGQENWGGLPRPPRGDLSNPRTEPASLMSPALEGHFFTPSTTWEDQGPPCNSYYLGVCLFISSFPWAQNLGNEPIPWTSLGNMCAESREEVLITMELSLSCPLARDFLFHFRQDSGKSANTHSQGRGELLSEDIEHVCLCSADVPQASPWQWLSAEPQRSASASLHEKRSDRKYRELYLRLRGV